MGLSQEELAARMCDLGQEVRQSDISRLERGGVRLPRRQRLEALATVLGLPLGALLERSGWSGAQAAFADAPQPAAPLVPESGAGAPPATPGVDPHAASDRLRQAVERAWELQDQARELVARSERTLRGVD